METLWRWTLATTSRLDRPFNLGDILVRQGHLDEAEAHYRTTATDSR